MDWKEVFINGLCGVIVYYIGYIQGIKSKSSGHGHSDNKGLERLRYKENYNGED